MTQAKVTSKGQVTIPLEVRQRLGLTAGSRIDFVWSADGAVTLEVVNGSLATLAGTLHRGDRAAVSLEEMQEAIRGAVDGSSA